MVRHLAGHHVRQESRTGHSLFNRLLGLGGQIDMSVAIALGAMSAIAVLAGVFMADVLQNHKVGWKVLQLLVFLLADALALLTAAGASLFRFIQVVLDGQTRQMFGKLLATVL